VVGVDVVVGVLLAAGLVGTVALTATRRVTSTRLVTIDAGLEGAAVRVPATAVCMAETDGWDAQPTNGMVSRDVRRIRIVVIGSFFIYSLHKNRPN
jgi:hypothetical protein